MRIEKMGKRLRERERESEQQIVENMKDNDIFNICFCLFSQIFK